MGPRAVRGSCHGRGGILAALLSLSVVILSYNRREALSHTLSRIAAAGWSASAQIIVVDNASSDGSPDMVRADFPRVELVALRQNTMIEGFNVGASKARNDVLLILDDDSWPDADCVESALEYMEAHRGTAGVMLHRRHPKTGEAEWPFDAHGFAGVVSTWPDMGCGNMIRREAWNLVQGYETGFVLYRNDTDLALKLLGAGYDVAFNPAWQVWHDSPVVVRKSLRWLHLSTRNWIWMSRRHGRGMTTIGGSLLGWMHAHRLAGARLAGQWNVLRGALAGIFTAAPALPSAVRPDGKAYRRLIELKARLRARKPPFR